MVEPAGLWELDDLTEFRRFDFPRLRGILAERKMRTRNVVVVEVAAQNPSHVPFAEDDYVVEAFTPNRSDEAFDIRILPRRTGCNENRLLRLHDERRRSLGRGLPRPNDTEATSEARIREDPAPFRALADLARTEDVHLGCNCPTKKNPNVHHCHTVVALQFMKREFPTLAVVFPK